MHHKSSKSGSPKKHQKTMPLGSQNHLKMHWNSMFSHPNTPRCSRNVIFGRIGLAMIFSAAIFPVLNQISSQNGLPKLLGVLTFGVILEFKTLFLRPPHFFSIFLAKMLKKCWNSIPINWKAHRMESKFDSQSYARLTDLPKGSYPPLPHQTATWMGAVPHLYCLGVFPCFAKNTFQPPH